MPLPSSAPPVPAGAASPAQRLRAAVLGERLYPLSFGCGPGHRRGEVQPSSSLAGHLPAVSDQPPAALPVPPGAPSSRVVFIHQHPHPDSEKPCTPVTTCPEALVLSCPLAWPLSRCCGCHRSLLGLSQGLTTAGSQRAVASSRLPGREPPNACASPCPATLVLGAQGWPRSQGSSPSSTSASEGWGLGLGSYRLGTTECSAPRLTHLLKTSRSGRRVPSRGRRPVSAPK